jgi:hypothetical protein
MVIASNAQAAAPQPSGAVDHLRVIRGPGLSRARQLAGLLLAAALATAAVAYARTVPHRASAPSDERIVGWMRTHDGPWAGLGVGATVGDPVPVTRGSATVTGHY